MYAGNDENHVQIMHTQQWNISLEFRVHATTKMNYNSCMQTHVSQRKTERKQLYYPDVTTILSQ